MRINFSVLLLLLAAVSCAERESNDNIINQDEFKVLPIDIEAEKFKLPEVIDEIELMRFEEGQEGLITEVRLLNKEADKLIFTSPGEWGIFIYSQLGELINKFNHKGEGPEEYHDIQNLWVENEQVFIYSKRSTKILVYNFLGDFISSTKLEEPYRDIFPLNKGYVAEHRDENQNIILVFLDANFQKQSTTFSRKDEQDFLSLTLNTFNEYKGNVAYKSVLSDTIYLISQDKELKPIIKLDFGNDWLWSDPEVQAKPDQAMSFVSEKKKVWAVESHLGERYIYLSYGLGFGEGVVTMFNRETGGQFRIELKKKDGEYIGFYPIQWKGDRLLVSMPSYDAVDLITGLKSEQIKYRQGTTLEKIESSENPVLMWVKFKEGY
ncbi:hypothetical protein OB69_06375 [Roseivirga seohaensis subsp. aquiponti]|uniref:6-bladed beta-propeller n=1 Tax=Roseivirga seohaensis subsp. aquiponti TaxID=1566026 RepID=A0A0L8AMD6_9BACT|nr:6-bladed beta-propeller [Roseivirga seohaensis]KOF03504.1 hypothetical protein OB69_06375 [Roseivirga seohaensis subsp. aquiponti]